ncbi:S8 family serine peptidase, partial [Cylindrospermopsis raciborskii]
MSLGIPSAFYTQPPEGQGDPVYNSWGRLIQELEQAGVTVVSAAGNSYAQNHQNPSLRENVSIPAIASTAAVGAVWQDGTVSNARWSGSRDNTTGADRLVSFSQRLSTYPGMLFAPGAIIESTLPGNQIGGLAGTSMATPMVSGVVALMQDAALTFGDRLLTPNEIRRILLDTADRIVDGDDEDTNVTPTGSTYLRIDVYDAVQAVDRLFTSPPTPEGGTSQFFRFVFNSSQQTEDFYQGYGYAAANTYTLGQSITPTGSLGSYTITEVINDQSGTVGEVAVTDYYDGSTGFGYAIYVDASGTAGLGSESGFAYNSNFGGPDTSFSSSDTADLQEPVVTYQLYYFTYNYNNDDPITTNVVEGDFYQGYGYATSGTYTVGQRINQSSPNETGNNGYYTIDSVFEGNYGLLNAVSVYSYYDGADGNGSDLGGAYGYASYVSGTGYGGLGTEEGYAYDYNYASTDTYFSKHNEANLSDGVVIDPPVQLYYFTYTYGNGDSYQGWGYANANTYQSGEVIPVSARNELDLIGQYVIDSVWESYGLVGQVTINSYYDGADGNNTDPGGSYGSAYYVSGSGYGGLGSESGYAYDYNYQSTDIYFDNFYEANLVTQQPGSQLYYFTYYYGNGDFYQGYGYAVAGTYTQDQRIDQQSANETGQTGYHIIDYVYDSTYSYASGYVYVTTYYDGLNSAGDSGYGYAHYVWGNGYSGLGSESGYAYDNAYQSTDTSFSTFNEANLVTSNSGDRQLYYFTYNYGNGDYYQGYGYAAAGTYTVGQRLYEQSANETGEIGYYDITAVYSDSFGYLNSVFVDYYYDADTGYGPAIYAYGSGYDGLGSESGSAYDANYLSTDTYFSKFYEVDLVVPSNDKQLYYFTYYYNDEGDYYQGYGYATSGTYTQDQLIDQTSPNETGGIGYYQITSISSVTYGTVGEVSVFHYNDADTNYGPAYSVWAQGYSGLGSESGYAYDYYYSSPDNYFNNYYEADLGNSSRVDLYYFTYYYNDNPATTDVIEGDYYQGYGYATSGTYTQNQRIDQANETGVTGYYKIDSVYANSNYSSANMVYVYNYYDGDTGYGWAWNAWGQGSAGLGSEYGYAYDYSYITIDPIFGKSGSTFYEADLISSYGTDTNATLATATNLGAIIQRTLSILDSLNTSSFSVGTDPGSNNLVPADVDMYRFELNQAGTISLETSRPQNGVEMDTILRLFDVYGNNLGTDDDTGSGFYSRLNAYLDAGTYYFGVSGYANFSYSPTSANSGVEGSNGDYAISIAFDTNTTPFVGDPNGTATGARDIGALSNFATAGGADVPSIIGLDTNVPGVDPTQENLIAVGDKDVDLIKFTVDPGLVIFQTSDYVPDYIGKFGQTRGQAYLDLLDSDGNGSFDDSIDTVLRLFDASGNQLAIDDDGGEGLLSRLEYVFTTAGTYYLGVSGHGNSTYNINTLPDPVDNDSSRRSGSTGSSLLSIILQPETAPQDPNGVFYGAIPVDLLYGSNLTLSEHIGTDILADTTISVTGGDVDLYRFVANESGVVLIDLDTAISNSLNTYLRIFDGNGIALPSPYFNDDSTAQGFNRDSLTELGNNSTDSFVRLDVTAGSTYYIGVSASGNQTYDLNNLDGRTNPSVGDYQINLQYGGGATTATDADGYIHANLPSFNLTQTNTGSSNLTSLQRNIANDDQVAVGATDVDFVKVNFQGTGTTPRILTATARGIGTGQSALVPTVYVFNGQGDRLSASTSSSSPNTVQISLNPGTDYYVAHIPHPQLSGREITKIKIKVSIKINIESEKSIRETVNQQKCHQNLFSISSNKNSHYP